jgi:hypothetical protein
MISECPPAFRRVEDVGFFDPDPWQLAALGAEPVALPGQFLFPGEQRLARLQPFVARNDPVRLHDERSFFLT